MAFHAGKLSLSWSSLQVTQPKMPAPWSLSVSTLVVFKICISGYKIVLQRAAEGQAWLSEIMVEKPAQGPHRTTETLEKIANVVPITKPDSILHPESNAFPYKKCIF